MLYNYFIPLLFLLTLGAYFSGTSKAIRISRRTSSSNLHSLPKYYGLLTALVCLLPLLLLFTIWNIAETPIITTIITKNLPPELLNLTTNELSLVLNDIKNIVNGDIVTAQNNLNIQKAADHYLVLQSKFRFIFCIVAFMVAAGITSPVYRNIRPELKARNLVEKVVICILILCSAIAILTTLGIVLSVLFEAIRFFKIVPFQEFLFGLDWSPQMAIREGQAGSSGAFGAVPIFTGTFLIALIAMAVAIPIGLMSAIYLSEYANKRIRTITKPLLEILAGVPTVVYGFFAALTVAPTIRAFGETMGFSVSSESALAAGLVMGIMIIPFVSSLSDDVIHAVPQTLRDGSLALGSTKFETVRNVIIPAALPGIVGAILLAISRAIGETMIVVMAAGLSSNLTANPFEAVTTVTVQIVTLLVGDQEFDSPKTLAAFALGLLLFVFTLCLNFIALKIVRKYREQYD
jgi:phosphate transport system permease protein